MKNLFGEGIEDKHRKNKEEILVNLYCDEIKEKECPITKNKWYYFGILILPVSIEESLYQELLKARFRVDDVNKIDKNSPYYSKNNRVVHFEELDADTYHIAKRWYDYLRSSGDIYFTILGVNQSKLDPTVFSKKDLFAKIYNRFFRTGVIYSLKKYFYDKKISIKYIFHEEGDQQYHEFFPWHIFYKIKTEYSDIDCLNDEVCFLNKAHKDNNRGNFIQLIDVILGATINSFHNSTNNEHKVMLTSDFAGLTSRLIKSPDNPNSRYCKNYHKRMSISFFPEKNIDPSDDYYEYKKRLNQFYKNRDMVFLNRDQNKLL
jgi:hypothetical protein